MNNLLTKESITNTTTREYAEKIIITIIILLSKTLIVHQREKKV